MIRRFSFREVLGLICLIPLAAAVMPSFCWGQEYPTKTIELIAPYPPGGLGPLVASLVAEEAKKYISKPMIVVHKPGAAGTIGAYYVGKAAPDGYTLMLTSPSTITTAYLIQNYEFSLDNFVFIAGVVSAPITLAVRADCPWKNLTQMIQYAKENPGVVTCGNPGAYASSHLHMLRFEKLTGIKLTHVPFKGSADAMAAVAGGHTMMAARYPSEGEPLVDAGKVRILSVLDAKRCKFYPNTPSSAEEGYGIVVMKSWRAVMGPRGIPKPILALLENMMKKITEDPGFIEKAEKLKIGVEFRAGEEITKEEHQAMKEFADLVKELNIKAN